VVYEGRLVLSIDMKALFANFLALLLLAVAAVGVYAADIAVVISSEANVYQEALEGFREVVRHRIVNVQTLKDNPAGWRDEAKKLRSAIEPDIVFVVGASALQVVSVSGKAVGKGTLLTSWTNVWSISSKPQRSIFPVGAQPRRSRRQNLPPACTPRPLLSWAASHVGSRF